MKLRFKLVFKKGPEVVATVPAAKKFESGEITEQMSREILTLEMLTERLTDLRLHVETEEVS